MTALDIEFICDLDKTLPCESPRVKNCPNPATWRFKFLPCGHGFLYCEPHKRMLQEFFEAPGKNKCNTCGELIDDLIWRKL